MVRQFSVQSRPHRMLDITTKVQTIVSESGVGDGLCVVFLQHTSAGLAIQENADPSAKHDLESWIATIAPEGEPSYTHTAEGPDDMPSHIKSVVTGVSLSIPILRGRLALGTWQGIYLWEFRSRTHERSIVVHVS